MKDILQEKEADIEMRLLMYLNRYGMFWKTEYAGNFVGKKMRKNNHPYILAGMPDISGVINGHAVYFEVKNFKNYKRILNNYAKYRAYAGTERFARHVSRQIYRIESLRAAGAVAGFVCSEKNCLKFLREASLA